MTKKTTTKRKCPHGKPIPLSSLQVCKLGEWNGDGPWGLFIDVYKGGSIQLAQGKTKRRMTEISKLVLNRLHGDWRLARLVRDIVRDVIDESDRPT